MRLGQNATNNGGTDSYKLFGNNNIEIDKTEINTSGVYVFKSEIGGTDTGNEGSDTEENTGDTEGGN